MVLDADRTFIQHLPFLYGNSLAIVEGAIKLISHKLHVLYRLYIYITKHFVVYGITNFKELVCQFWENKTFQYEHIFMGKLMNNVMVLIVD